MHAAGLQKVTNASATAQLAVGHRCVLVALQAFQTGLAADAYIQLFDAAATSEVTVGTTVPDWIGKLDFGNGEVSDISTLPKDGLVFTRGIVVASTTTATGSSGNTTQVRLAIV